MLSLAALVFGVALAADGAGAVGVSASGHGLAVVAHGAPLSVVLEEIGRHSGTRVTYEGAAPGTLVTCDFLAATPAEALLRALEGVGLNYALYGGTLDVPGILIVSAPSGAAAPKQTSMTTRHGQPSGEVATVIDSPDEEPPTLATPPPGGAIPPRFMRPGQAEPASEGAEDDGRPLGEPGMIQPPETPSQIPSLPTPQERRAARQQGMGRPGPRGGGGNRQN